MIGDYTHLVTFQEPGDPVPDGVGGYTQTWQDLTPPTWKVQIASAAAAADQQRVASGTVLTAVVSTVRGHYHPGVTTRARMLYNGQDLHDHRGARPSTSAAADMELTAVEQGTP